jgi:CubicO group peptidase (beta-lactamase class C family)
VITRVKNVDGRDLDAAETAAPPRDYWPTTAWRAAEPEAMGMSADKLAELEPLLRSRLRGVKAAMVVRKGYVVFDWRRPGCGSDQAHNVASVTKSVISALVGIALEAGWLRSVEQKVFEFFPEYRSSPGDARKRDLTLRHLLTMTAPVAWQTGAWAKIAGPSPTPRRSFARGYEPLDRLRRQKDWVRFILDLVGNEAPGRFQYSAVCPHLISAILTRATGTSARELANERLFRPLGMKEIPDREMPSFGRDDVIGENVTGWVKDPSGVNTGGWGLTMSVADMARLGFLYLNRGGWDGRRIVPEEWIAESTAPNDNDYGHYWWLRGSGRAFSYSAAGSGGNLICCVPGLDLVVAIAAKVVMKSPDPWLPVERCILPAIAD